MTRHTQHDPTRVTPDAPLGVSEPQNTSPKASEPQANASAVPSMTDDFDVLHALSTPNLSSKPAVPVAADTSTDNSHSSSVLGEQNKQEKQGEANTSSTPDALGALGASGTPSVSDISGTSGTPNKAGMPNIPGIPDTPNAPQPPKPPALSLFTPLDAQRPGIGQVELDYINEVDAALARRPTKGVYVLSGAVGCFFLILLIWAAFATVDEVTHAEGQVVSSQRTQSIQNLEGGILQELLVHEGQIVEKNAPLARLENVLAGSSYRDAFNRMLDNIAAIIRLEAELNNTEPVFPENLTQNFEEITTEPADETQREKTQQIISDHMSTFRARAQQRAAELQLLESQRIQRQKDVEEQLSRKNQLEKSLHIAVEQRDIALPLMQRRNLSRTEFLNMEQRVVSLQGDVENLAAALPKAQAAAKEAEQRILFRQAELNTAVNEEISKRRTELASLRETLSAGGDRVARTELRSPVRGTVKQIHLSSVGGVVKPGESIMDIVPLDETLLVEARVRPSDVAFLHPGQKAVVKISAYDFSIYGGLEGQLEQISADTIEDKRGEFHYLVKARTKETALTYRNEKLPIIPGMVCTVDILTGKKTILDYLLKPILKARQNALRER